MASSRDKYPKDKENYPQRILGLEDIKFNNERLFLFTLVYFVPYCLEIEIARAPYENLGLPLRKNKIKLLYFSFNIVVIL